MASRVERFLGEICTLGGYTPRLQHGCCSPFVAGTEGSFFTPWPPGRGWRSLGPGALPHAAGWLDGLLFLAGSRL